MNDGESGIVDTPGDWFSLTCRSIRIGNYKFIPKDKITVTKKGVQIKVPSITNNSEVVTINILTKDIFKVLIYFGKKMPLLFLYISPSTCQETRKLLRMTNSQSLYFDVESTDETQKRITILPKNINEDNKVCLMQYFSNVIQELEGKDANKILTMSSPKGQDIQRMKDTCRPVRAVSEKGIGDSQPGPVMIPVKGGEDPGAARFGNFINYYSFNPPENRMKTIPEDLLSRLDLRESPVTILDIGCNAGVRF